MKKYNYCLFQYADKGRLTLNENKEPDRERFRPCVYSTFEEYFEAWQSNHIYLDMSEEEADKVLNYHWRKFGQCSDEMLNRPTLTDCISINSNNEPVFCPVEEKEEVESQERLINEVYEIAIKRKSYSEIEEIIKSQFTITRKPNNIK